MTLVHDHLRKHPDVGYVHVSSYYRDKKPKKTALVAEDVTDMEGGQEGRLVIQSHAAKKAGFHFDLRFDVGKGVAHSFATRKLPGPGESVKIIAQPDHPLGYMDYEGPLFGYGQGRVSKHLEAHIDVHEAAKNKVVFSIHGHRNSSDVALVHLGGKVWMMRNFSLQKKDIQPYLNRDKYRNRKFSTLNPEADGEEYSAKIDGAHAVAILEKGKRPRVFSYRTSKDGGVIEYTHKFAKEFFSHRVKTPGRTIVRGEVYAEDKTGAAAPYSTTGSILNATVVNSKKAQEADDLTLRFALFDVLEAGGVRVEGVPFAQKRAALEQIVKNEKNNILTLPERAVSSEERKELLRKIIRGKLKQTKEGVVVHSGTGPPAKAKPRPEFDVYIRGFFAGKDRLAKVGVGGFFYSFTPKGTIAGRVGSGISDEDRADMATNPESYLGKVARVRADQKLPSGALRAPSYDTVHWEKSASMQMTTAVQHKGTGQDPFTTAVTQWQRSGYNRKYLGGVLTHLRPIVAKRAHDYPQSGSSVTTAELTRAALKGLRKFDTTKGAKASTWAISSMREANRPLVRKATPVRVPDERLQLVGKYQRALEEFGSVVPTPQELAKKMGTSAKNVLMLRKEIKPVHTMSKEEVPRGDKPAKIGRVWRLIYPELSVQEKQVYDILRKNPTAQTRHIAGQLGVSPAAASRYKKGIYTKVDSYGRGSK